MREPAFQAPWHAQLFALTLHLSKQELFTWGDWTQAFGATLKTHGLSKDLDGTDDYYAAWLETLEQVLIDKDLARDSDIATLVAAWRDAYVRTPHGQPVALSLAQSSMSSTSC